VADLVDAEPENAPVAAERLEGAGGSLGKVHDPR
jgi:hypothetical protein